MEIQHFIYIKMYCLIDKSKEDDNFPNNFELDYIDKSNELKMHEDIMNTQHSLSLM